jgi:hypothetical protein
MDAINQIHSILRWLILLVLLYTIIKAFMGMQQKSLFSNADDKGGLILTILVDIQLLIGLVQYFQGAWGLKNIQNIGMGAVMKDGYARFFAMEHILMMLVAVILIHVGRSKSKKAIDDLAKHKKAFWYYLIALILILAAIPWPFRKGFEALNWI